MSSRYHHGAEEMDVNGGDIFARFVNDDNVNPNNTAGGVELHHESPRHYSASVQGHFNGGDFELSPTTLDGSALMSPTGAKSKTPRSRSSRSRKGRPTRMMLPQGAPTGTAYVNVGRAFPGLTMVYRCPFAHCTRFYATKLALRRHYVSYNHMITTEYIEFDTNPLLTPEEVKRKAIQSMPRCYKCPVLECKHTFQDVFGLCGHFSESHAPISEPTISKRQRTATPYHELMEWTELYDECLDLTYHFHVDLAQNVPDMFTARDDKSNWRFLSIFDIVGPRPSYKRAQFVHHLREILLRNYSSNMNNTLIVTEDILKLMITLAFCEMMPAAYMLTRDYTPSANAHLDADGILDPWNDDEFMWQICSESVESMLKYGAVHSSRNFVKKAKIRRSLTPEDDPEQLLEKEDLSNDRFVCQVPGCGKVFASVPAYKYHMHHFEHDIEALLGSSSLLRQVLFPLAGQIADDSSAEQVNMNQGVNWYQYERLNLRFVTGKGDEASEPLLINLIYSVNDAVHILHGYIDQQLPIAFSWQLMRKREMTTIHPLTNEFTLTFKKGDIVSMMKAAPGATHIPLTSAPQKRKKKPFLFPPSTLGPLKKQGMPFASGAYNGASGGPGSANSYNSMMLMIGQGEEGQSLGLDPWTIGKPIPVFEREPGLEMKFLPSEGVLPYQQSKLILPIHPSGGHVPGEEHLGTWLDYSSILQEEALERNSSSGNSITVIVNSKSDTTQSEINTGTGSNSTTFGGSTVPVSEVFSEGGESLIFGTGHDGVACVSVRGDIDKPVALSSVDWFPHMAPHGDNMYVVSLVTAGSETMNLMDPNAILSSCSSDVYLWNVVLIRDNDLKSSNPTSGYRIHKVVFNGILSTVAEQEGRAFEGGPVPARVTVSSVLSVKWYPFPLQADTNEADMKGMLAVLYSNGEILVYVLPRHVVFPSHIDSPSYKPQHYHWKEICRISIPLYSISAFCWNKQQTIMPSSQDLGAAPSTVMTTQLLLGTKEGSIGICDLSLPTQPQMLMLVAAHPSLITSIDWSPLNPLSVITSSLDGTVHLWNLADMYHSITLATSKGPFLQAQWLYKLSKPYDARTAAHDYVFPRTSGVDVDPARQVLVMDDAHFAKILHVDEPGKMALLPTPLPRPWCSVYPNARLQSPLIVSADWTGNVSVVTWRSENDLKKSLFSHTIIQWVLSNSATRVFRGITGSPSNVGSIQNSSQISGVGPTGQQNISSEDLPVGFTAISWHPLPIGLFAVVSSTGLLYLHSL